MPRCVPICEGMNHDIKGNIANFEWPTDGGESIFMQDPSFHTPCWRHWVNRQKASGVKDVTWDELHDLWTSAFGGAEARAPSNTRVAEIERILHKPARQPRAHGRAHTSSAGRLSAPTTPFEPRFYTRSNSA